MTRVLLTLLVGLVVSLGALVSAGGSGVAWAGNWNTSPRDKIARLANDKLCKVAAIAGENGNRWSPDDYYSDHVAEAKKRGLNCGINLQFPSLGEATLCLRAVMNGSWDLRPQWVDYSSEAKRRGLSCGVGEVTQTASATTSEDWKSTYVSKDFTPEQIDKIISEKDWSQLVSTGLCENGYAMSGSVARAASSNEICDLATNASGWVSSTGDRRCFYFAAKSRGLSCGMGGASSSTQIAAVPNSSSGVTFRNARQESQLANLNSSTICKTAVDSYTKTWSESVNYRIYVQEAKRRGLSCGVGEANSSIQIVSVPNPKPQVTSAALTAAQRKADVERQKRIKLEQELATLRAEKAKQQQTISSDTSLPTITIASASSDGPQGTVKGRVTDNTGIAEVRVDGKQIQTDSDGNFTTNTYVPEGGVSVSIQAVDLAGLSSSMAVRLDRSASNTATSISFERLNPLGRKVAKNKDALALIIGVDGYKSTPARAIYADSDAKVFADYASQKLGIPSNRIKTLVNDGAGEREMLLSVKSWLSRASRQGKSDVYVFFAGHGLASDDGQKMYLLPYDGAPELLEKTAILRQELFDDIASANPRSVTVFLDTCYSGTTRGTDMLIASRPIAIKALEQSIPDNFTVFTAAAGDQTAKPLEEAKHGMFSYFLMKGMEGEADENQDNKITAGELHQYVQQNVVQQSSGSQTPELQGDAGRVLVRFQ